MVNATELRTGLTECKWREGWQMHLGRSFKVCPQTASSEHRPMRQSAYGIRGVRRPNSASPPAAAIAHPPINTRPRPTVIAVCRAMPAPPTVIAIDSRAMPASPAAVPPIYLSHVRFICLSRKDAWASGQCIRRGAKSGGNHCYKGGGYDRSTHAQLLTLRRSPCVIRPSLRP